MGGWFKNAQGRMQNRWADEAVAEGGNMFAVAKSYGMQVFCSDCDEAIDDENHQCMGKHTTEERKNQI